MTKLRTVYNMSKIFGYEFWEFYINNDEPDIVGTVYHSPSTGFCTAQHNIQQVYTGKNLFVAVITLIHHINEQRRANGLKKVKASVILATLKSIIGECND